MNQNREECRDWPSLLQICVHPVHLWLDTHRYECPCKIQSGQSFRSFRDSEHNGFAEVGGEDLEADGEVVRSVE